MSTKKFIGMLEEQGFRIDKLFNPQKSPLLAQAVKIEK
jgi:hypothetical protein